jgi:phosphatidylglycerophosphatase A
MAWVVATAESQGGPWAPGTAGSVVGLAAGAAAVRVINPWWYLGLVGALFALGVAASGHAEREARRRDPSFIVIDEVVGMLAALFALPARAGVFAAAFLCFRVLDIYKPFPLRRLERWPGGWGIMLDDLAAGVCRQRARAGRLVGAGRYGVRPDASSGRS